MKLLALVTSFTLAATISGCGKKEAVKAIQDAVLDPTGDITSDAVSLADEQSDTLDEIATAINENGSGGAASALTEMMLAPGTPVTRADALGSRTCTADTAAGTVTVVLNYDKTKTDSASKAGRIAAASKVTSEVKGEGTLTRLWTLPAARAADAKCTPSAHFQFKGKGASAANVDDVSLLETEDRTRTMSVSKAGKTLTGRTMKTAGTRSVTFDTVADGSATYQKTITTNVTRTITLTKPNGGTITREKKMSMPTPLVVKVTRSAEGELTQKLITQGQTKAEVTADNVEVTTTFSNVKYDLTSTNDNKCTPVSGTISGETKKAGAVVKSYTIDFGADSAAFASGISIKVGDAAAVDCPNCVVAKCDMD